MTVGKSYITTPIYYVNGAPHIGHAHTSVMGDILKRARKLGGETVKLTTGTDEHGQKNEEAALSSGLAVQDYLTQQSSKFAAVFDSLGVSYDYFVRTTRLRHMQEVARVESELRARNLLVKKPYSGLYCSGCEQFKKPSDLTEDGRCRDHPTLTAEQTDETNYFFMIEPFRQRLRDYIRANPTWIQPQSYGNEVLSALEEPLEDLCISRPKTRVGLGVELPFDPDYVTYVWFDALINYLTNIDWPDAAYEDWWPFSEHLIGKDIVKTHCIYWPCILMALGVDMPARISVHGHWVGSGGVKMSKTVGNVVDPVEVIDRYGASALRFYLARHMRTGSDSQISLELLEQTYNIELGNKLGNLLLRCVKFAGARFDGVVPSPNAMGQEETATLNTIRDQARIVLADLQNLTTIPSALSSLVAMINMLNDHVTQRAPWTLIKNPEAVGEAGGVLYALLDSLRLVFEVLFPIMPDISARGLAVLGIADPSFGERKHELERGLLRPGSRFGEADVLFPRINA
jgi:methionyl-tRNA synthetase